MGGALADSACLSTLVARALVGLLSPPSENPTEKWV